MVVNFPGREISCLHLAQVSLNKTVLEEDRVAASTTDLLALTVAEKKAAAKNIPVLAGTASTSL